MFGLECAVLQRAVHQVHRRRPDEARDERVRRRVVDLGRRPHLLDHAALHHHHTIGQRHRLDLVMGYVDCRHRQLMAEVLDLCPGRDAELGIQVRQRLIHQEHVWLPHDCPGQGHALTLTARELGRLPVQELVKLDHGAGAHHLLVMGGGINAAHLQREADVLVDVHVGIERVTLEHHRHVAVLRFQIVDHRPVDGDLAFGDILESGDHPHRRRLAAA